MNTKFDFLAMDVFDSQEARALFADVVEDVINCMADRQTSISADTIIAIFNKNMTGAVKKMVCDALEQKTA